VQINDPLDDGQSDTGAFAVGIQLLEEAEDLFVMSRVHAHTVVPYVEDRFLIGLPGSDLHLWVGLFPKELDRIVQKVLHDLQQPGPIANHFLKIRGDFERDASFSQPARHHSRCLMGDRPEFDLFRWG